MFCQCSWKVNKIGISPWDWANSSSLKLSATPLATMAMMPTQAKLLHTVSMVTTASFSAMPSPPSQHVFCPLTAHTHQSDAQNSGTMTASLLCESFRFASQKSSAEPGLINVKSHPTEKKTWELEVSLGQSVPHGTVKHITLGGCRLPLVALELINHFFHIQWGKRKHSFHTRGPLSSQIEELKKNGKLRGMVWPRSGVGWLKAAIKKYRPNIKKWV